MFLQPPLFKRHLPSQVPQQLLMRPLWRCRAGALDTLATSQAGAEAVLLVTGCTSCQKRSHHMQSVDLAAWCSFIVPVVFPLCFWHCCLLPKVSRWPTRSLGWSPGLISLPRCQCSRRECGARKWLRHLSKAEKDPSWQRRNYIVAIVSMHWDTPQDLLCWLVRLKSWSSLSSVVVGASSPCHLPHTLNALSPLRSTISDEIPKTLELEQMKQMRLPAKGITLRGMLKQSKIASRSAWPQWQVLQTLASNQKHDTSAQWILVETSCP